MGVRGLTTYIARNSDKYLKDHKLHDTYLVIDGNNLAAQLYKWHAKCYDCFGGDYDTYAKTITDFFEMLEKCNVVPLVIFDGSYENKKLRTIYGRVKSRIETVRKLNASTEGSVQVFPLFLRELFTETVVRLGCRAVRCDFEADYEMACVARTLDCPVLSYDSDFYIFDVLYIPFSTLSMQARRVKGKEKSYYAVDCKMYRVENFLSSLGGMDKENLPLLAALLGNDYIKMSVFQNFYSQLKLVTRKSEQSDQIRRIETVIRWLKKETFVSAARKILGRVKLVHRKKVAEQIQAIADGYKCVDSKMLPYLNVTAERRATHDHPTQLDLNSLPVEEVDDAADSNGHTSDESVDVGEVSEHEIDSLTGVVPEWFLTSYRGCTFPAWFVDIAVHNRYFFIPQVENTNEEHSHSISLRLLAALHKILTSGKKEVLTYVARSRNHKLENRQLERTDLELPTLEDVENEAPETRKAHLFRVLELDVATDALLQTFPADWRVFVASIIFWARNSPIRKSHVYALLMCATTLKIVDAKIGYIRTLSKLHKYEKTLKPGDDSEKECVNYMREMIPHFYMDEKMYRNPNQYDSQVVGAFSHFQSGLFHIKHLNKVLGGPYDDFLVSDFYNGTFVYGMYVNLNRRSDVGAYLRNLLSDARTILEGLTDMSDRLFAAISSLGEWTGKRRRKRKGRNRSRDDDGEDGKMVCAEDDGGDGAGFDVNNQYSILNFVKSYFMTGYFMHAAGV